MEWFTDHFLSSLEERYHERGKLWLTAKQANVCKRYMEYGTVRGNLVLDLGSKRYCVSIMPNGGASFFIINLETGFCMH